MNQSTGLLLMVTLLLLTAGIQYGRVDLLTEENPPAVSVSQSDGIWVELGEGFPVPGVHQFIDDMTLRGVIQMTTGHNGIILCENNGLDRPLASGDFLSLEFEDAEIIKINRGWMTAARRMILNIPLRPQTMTAADWLALPGIGVKLANSIEQDRQKNGDFASFAELERVPGIGPGRLAAWKKYF